MTYKEKFDAVRKAAPRHHISGDGLPRGYWPAGALPIERGCND